jgi:NapC/NirT cytochrome c family, N-terminal region
MIQRLLDWAHDLLAKANVPLTAVGLLVLGLAGFEGMVAYNQSGAFCEKCHVNRGPFRNIDLSSVAHKPYVDGRATCVDCHTDKEFHEFLVRTAHAAGQGFSRLTQDTHRPTFKPRDVDDGKCLVCHNAILEQENADRLELSPELAKIGLKFSHARHFAMREFDAEQRDRLDQLKSMSRLNDEEKAEQVFLEKVSIGACAFCHERNQLIDPTTGARKIDRSINLFARNPIGCSGCHVDAVVGDHPGNTLAPPLGLPSETTCRRCHNGRVHGRIVTFEARCEKNSPPFSEQCAKCHPNIDSADVKTEPTPVDENGMVVLGGENWHP